MASTDVWEYSTFSFSKLNTGIADPTADCKQSTLLVVLGHLGWELVQVFDEGLPRKGRIQGQVALGRPNSQGQQQGTLLLEEQSSASGMAIFKRKTPHARSELKC